MNNIVSQDFPGVCTPVNHLIKQLSPLTNDSSLAFLTSSTERHKKLKDESVEFVDICEHILVKSIEEFL